MQFTPLTNRASEVRGDLISWLRENAETNDAAMERLKRNLLKAVNEELTPKQRETLLMYYFEDLSMAEIAEKQGVTLSTVSRSITRAKKRLERVLKYSL